ncbi:hypothetical protein J437_LFUL008425 [Ladona fulva]|uniref:Fanconi-associated nuclease n=1 Tax=Ladona fulva TaxID=123851 RepID=A0A8K0JTZ8_LADFU|nr:hypothetical protein J437_LFUL008425 [Ladona fulva]
MDRSILSISNEEAERIKKDAAKQYEKLRESLQSTGNKEDKSSFARNYPTQGQISEAERIKEAASEILAKLRESISSSEGRGELSEFAVGANIDKEVNVDKQPNLHDHVLCSGKEEVNGAYARNERNKGRGVRSSTQVSDTSYARVDDTVDSSVNKSNQNCSISYSEAIKGSSLLPRKEGCAELVVQLEEDVSPIIIDYTNPLPSTSSDVDLSLRSLSNNLLQSGSPTRNLKGLCSETEISVDSCRKSGDRRKEVGVLQSVESHSWENFAAHLVAVRGNINLRNLFVHDDLTIFGIFTGLSLQAQAVFIQLLNSEYTWYRESGLLNSGDDDLNAEMSRELKSVIDTLIEKRLLITDAGDEKNDSLIRLLSLEELKNVCRILGLRDDGRKGVLIKSLIEFSNKQKIMDRVVGQDYKDTVKDQILKVLGRVIKLNHAPRELFLRTQLLYGLPLTKTMTVDGRVPLITIMNDVRAGKISYPDYTWEPLQNLFPSRDSLVRFQQALHLEANIKWRMKLKEFDEVTHLYESAFIQFQEELKDEHASEWSAGLPNCLQTFTRGAVLARAVHQSIECLRVKKMYTKMISAYETLLSQDLYLKLYKGMWYDQLARIYQSIMKDVSKTVIFLTEALADPSLNYIDRVLLSDRASPLVSGRKRKRTQMYEELKRMLSNLRDIPEISIDARCFDA